MHGGCSAGGAARSTAVNVHGDINRVRLLTVTGQAHAPGLVAQDALDVVAVVQLVVKARRHIHLPLWVAVLHAETVPSAKVFVRLRHTNGR